MLRNIILPYNNISHNTVYPKQSWVGHLVDYKGMYFTVFERCTVGYCAEDTRVTHFNISFK